MTVRSEAQNPGLVDKRQTKTILAGQAEFASPPITGHRRVTFLTHQQQTQLIQVSEDTPLLPQLARQFSPPQVGDTITTHGRKYLIGNALGNGFFGTVFECSDEWGNRLVAKVLNPRDRTYEAVREDWLREVDPVRWTADRVN